MHRSSNIHKGSDTKNNSQSYLSRVGQCASMLNFDIEVQLVRLFTVFSHLKHVNSLLGQSLLKTDELIIVSHFKRE